MSSATSGRSQFERDEVVKIVQSVIHKMEDVTDKSRETVLEELVKLARVIEETRNEIGQIGAGQIGRAHVATATDELDAVVEATKDATFNIMDACEHIQNISSTLPAEQSGMVSDQVIRIFEACSFQDITGQRISKVIKLLKEIETKVEGMLQILGHFSPQADAPDTTESKTGDEALLNGPQLPGNALSQDEIDKLLNGF